MSSQKTVEKLRIRNAELEELNKNLLNNNVLLTDQAKALKVEIGIVESQRNECKSKCEIEINKKTRLLQEKEEYLKSLKTTFQNLKNAEWFYRVEQRQDGAIEITHTVKTK